MFGITTLASGSHVKVVAIGILNQLLGGGVGFVLALYLAMKLGHAEFGLYTIGFAATLLYVGIGNALITTQMVTHLPRIDEVLRGPFASVMLGRTLLLGLGTIGLVLLAANASPAKESSGSVSFMIASGAAAAAGLLKEFFVRWMYSCRREGCTLAINCVMVVATAGAILLFLAEESLNAATGLYSLAIGFAASSLIGFALSGIAPPSLTFRRCPVSSQSGPYLVGADSLWAVAGTVVIWLQTQAHVYLGALLLGPVAVGQISTARLFVAPFFFVLPALSQLALPRFASLSAHAPEILLRYANLYGAVLAGSGALYAGVVLLVYPWVAPHVENGGGLHMLIAAWGLVIVTQLIREGASTPLQALRQFRGILSCNVSTAAATIVAGCALSARFGGPGAVIGIALGESLLAFALWRLLRNVARDQRPPFVGAHDVVG
jgi:O-antigen/teichoic acid export membrane protein